LDSLHCISIVAKNYIINYIVSIKSLITRLLKMKESTKAVMGQPKKYKPEYAQELIKYFSIPAYQESPSADGTDKKYLPNVFPTFERFSANIMVTQKTMTNWYNAKYPEDYEDQKLALTPKYPEWREAYDIAKSLQAANLTEGGMTGAYVSSFANKAAVNLIQWRDKQEIELKADIKSDVKSITREMSNEEAALAYQSMCENKDD